MSKAISLGYLFKVSAGNVNASHTEGNVMVTKKVTLPDGSTLPYISGQAIRRMLRDRLEDLGWALSEPFCKVSGQEVTPPVRPWDFIDEDLFGYLDPSGGKRRTSPVRVSAAIGLFPFQGDRDLGTRSFEKFGQAMSEGGNMFETELYANLFRGAILIELDRVGSFTTLEINTERIPENLIKEENLFSLHPTEKRNRLQTLLEALSLLWGGGRTARMLADLSPRFLAYARLSVKHPVFLENIEVEFQNGKYRLMLAPLKNAMEKFQDRMEKAIFGLEPGFFVNEEEIRDNLSAYGDVVSLSEAIGKAKKDVEELWKD
ncbi:CRISPR-associated autoregulator, DevR family [Thermodesulfatator indicus DSM 15286]|uniref:CRISPR-associated autoregulator, DevR family n=1 Tax=Thermodesulfatator indicus (strain DSM 15286 / JCM 11887 / CIR29812) TaxID=667014 RepID=F8A9G8_THEID|nr:type I-B CRISPR-associated protein Cas7/Cst2/DevR [Thermodesulfatator indicus]AEH44112.1 CRISPR-associated autoregulator, DevR family [Thermodesulfatator indicus DSM 15286]